MNLGQLTSLTNCEYCGLPMEIYPDQKGTTCKQCGKRNDLEFKFSVGEGEKITRDYQYNSSFIPDYWSSNIMSIKDKTIKKKLNISRINSLDDVKRLLEFFNIEIEIKEGIINDEFEKVKDLFE
ncbi:hypothetical protein ACSW9O_15460 (plasmid) [Clostridium perfringens]